MIHFASFCQYSHCSIVGEMEAFMDLNGILIIRDYSSPVEHELVFQQDEDDSNFYDIA